MQRTFPNQLLTTEELDNYEPELFSVFAKARRIDGVDKRMVSIKGDVLSVRGKKYTVDTLNELDGDLDMRHFNERSNGNVVVMGGMYSNFHPLSNYY